jgi:hypothetical protein
MNARCRACFLSRELCIIVMAIMMLARARELCELAHNGNDKAPRKLGHRKTTYMGSVCYDCRWGSGAGKLGRPAHPRLFRTGSRS